MSMYSCFRRLCHFLIPRLVAVMLVALAWSSFAFCDEMHDAARDGDLEKVKSLLQDNPYLVSSQDNIGRAPMDWAAMKTKRLLHRQRRQERLNQALLAAVKKNRANEVKALLAQGANPNTRDKPARSPQPTPTKKLSRSSGPQQPSTPVLLLNCSTDIFRLLLEYGADPNATRAGGYTALIDAAIENNLDRVKLLLAYGAHVNQKNIYGRTALMEAACYQTSAEGAKIIEMLLAHGAKLEARDEDGFTALILSSYNRYDACKILIAHGANIHAVANKGETPLSIAKSEYNYDVIRILKRAGEKR